MRKEVLIARTKPNSYGQYDELYMTGYRNGPAMGFIYRYDPSPGAKKNRVKKRLVTPLFMVISGDPKWNPAVNENLAPSLWDPNSDDPMAEYADRIVSGWFSRVR